MTDLEQAEAIAEKLRQEPYNFLKNDCVTKSVRLKRQCRALGIVARVVVCVGVAPARVFGRQVTLPVIHGWGEVEGRRIETSRPLGSATRLGIVPVKIRPVIAIRL